MMPALSYVKTFAGIAPGGIRSLARLMHIRHPSRMSENRSRPVRPRHAASLIALRAGRDVLMGLRGARHRFMPNRLVFPGGAVDRGDARAPAAAEPSPVTLAELARAGGPVLARGLCIAAAREMQEETGLSLGTPPDLSHLHYLCRAVTPPDSPIRFNARFLVVDAAHLRGELAGSGELEDLRWYPLAAALALDLVLVTREILLTLSAWLALAPADRLARAATPVFQLRRWRQE